MSRATRLFPGSPRQTSKLFSLCNERHLCCLWLNGLPICQDLSSSCPVVLLPSPLHRRFAILSLSVFSSPLSFAFFSSFATLLSLTSHFSLCLSRVLFLPPSSSLPLSLAPLYPDISYRASNRSPRMSLTHRTRACSGREHARPIGCGSVPLPNSCIDVAEKSAQDDRESGLNCRLVYVIGCCIQI